MKNQNQKSPETGIKNEVPDMADKKTMIPEEKALLQAKQDRKSTRLNSSHANESRMPSSA